MTKPIDSGRPSFPPSHYSPSNMHQGANALSAPISSGKEAPIVDRSKVSPEIIQSAEGMEALFIDYMLKVMRQTIPKNDMDLESPASEIYRGMIDSEYAEKAAHHGGIGLADQIIAYLVSRGYDRSQGQGVPTKEKP